jgi:hypothetical protein
MIGNVGQVPGLSRRGQLPGRRQLQGQQEDLRADHAWRGGHIRPCLCHFRQSCPGRRHDRGTHEAHTANEAHVAHDAHIRHMRDKRLRCKGGVLEALGVDKAHEALFTWAHEAHMKHMGRT